MSITLSMTLCDMPYLALPPSHPELLSLSGSEDESPVFARFDIQRFRPKTQKSESPNPHDGVI